MLKRSAHIGSLLLSNGAGVSDVSGKNSHWVEDVAIKSGPSNETPSSASINITQPPIEVPSVECCNIAFPKTTLISENTRKRLYLELGFGTATSLRESEHHHQQQHHQRKD